MEWEKPILIKMEGRYWSDESESRGQFIDGKENGKWEEYRFGKITLEGYMLDGEKNGKWKRYFQGTNLISNVKVSKFGRQLQPKKYIGLTSVKAMALFVKDMGLDIYATKEGFKSEIEKRDKSYPTISNITMPKNTDIK